MIEETTITPEQVARNIISGHEGSIFQMAEVLLALAQNAKQNIVEELPDHIKVELAAAGERYFDAARRLTAPVFDRVRRAELFFEHGFLTTDFYGVPPGPLPPEG